MLMMSLHSKSVLKKDMHTACRALQLENTFLALLSTDVRQAERTQTLAGVVTADAR